MKKNPISQREAGDKGAAFGVAEQTPDRFAGYVGSISSEEDEEREFSQKDAFKEMTNDSDSHDPFKEHRKSRIADRENEYQARRLNRPLSPQRSDPFLDKTPAAGQKTYKDVMGQHNLDKEEAELVRAIDKKKKDEEEDKRNLALKSKRKVEEEKELPGPTTGSAKKGRWDRETVAPPAAGGEDEETEQSDWDTDSNKRDRNKEKDAWEETPARSGEAPAASDSTPAAAGSGPSWDSTPARKGPRSRWDQTTGSDETPAAADTSKSAAGWEATPKTPSGGSTPFGSTPGGSKKGGRSSRWDQTPAADSGNQTPGATPVVKAGSKTASVMNTPSTAAMPPMTPEQISTYRMFREIEERNRPLSDKELDEMLPTEGFEILVPPATYKPIRTPARKLQMTPTPVPAGYTMPAEATPSTWKSSQTGETIPLDRPEDRALFGDLLEDVDEDSLSREEANDRQIMVLLLKIKNGTPPQRKSALRQITENARKLGAGPLFNQILPILMSPTLEDQERHLMVKVIDRILYKLDDLVRPYVHKILVVIEPLLIDEDYYARVEGREIISNLAKAAGLATMIAVMRPDIDNVDEYVRNTTARAFSVVASALGIHQLLPFLKAVCQSKRSWQARHTGIKIVQQIAILMGCAILPHLRSLVEIIEHGLNDDQSKVRCITALALSALAEAAHPYGIESFDSVLRPLWKGIRQHRGKTLAAFLKAIGYIIPLMDSTYANYYTREVMVVVIREFSTPDEEMKKIVLAVVEQCVATEGVEPEYIRKEILPEFFRQFWVRRMALDRRNYAALVKTTCAMANKTGGADVIGRIVEFLKDESEPFRKMALETIQKVMAGLGTSDIDQRLEELLFDGLLYAFQEQASEDTRVMLDGFGVVVNALGLRSKPYLPQVCGIIKWRLNNKAARVRQQSGDLLARIAQVMKKCGEDQLLCHLGVVLYEYLGEEYPEVLGSILGAVKAVVNVIGMENMTPPIKDLLPRLTPILRNRHERVQENLIDLIGRIADRGAEYVAAKEWMRICFELIELLKAPVKAIRRATVNTFGYIAKAIGPQDVLVTLMNNLKVQERTSRVCTTVAIGIVAETCLPFTVLPALMNEYRVPDLNVQNGVLKSLSFMFEYIGEMAKDYVYAVTPLLEDALMDRDLVHRQIAINVIKHMALGVVGLGREDAMLHLMNYLWPNIFETSLHLITGVFEAIQAMEKAVGPTTVLQYVLQGLWHPARKVRVVYWKLYNQLYIGNTDSLTPAYPRVDDEPSTNNVYRRWDLEVFI